MNTEATGGPTLSFISTTTTGARKTCQRSEEKEKDKEKEKGKENDLDHANLVMDRVGCS